jgi:hypothetical protein
VVGGLRLRALWRGLPTEDIGRAYGTAMRKSSRAGRIAPGRLSTCRRPYARQAWPPVSECSAGAARRRTWGAGAPKQPNKITADLGSPSLHFSS